MAVQLSVTAQALVEQIGIQPQIILDIEGVDLIFGARPILKVLEWDEDSPDALWDNDLNWDGTIGDPKSRDWISLTDTTTSIGQQIAPDKGSTSSISTVNIAIVDKNAEVSKALSFNEIGDILGRKAIFSIGFANGTYPEDANPIFRGVIVDFYTDAGKVMLSLASPESIKRQLFLEKFQTKLFGPFVDIGGGVIGTAVESTAGFYPPQDALETYFRINDEIVKIVEIVSDTLLYVERAQLNTVEASHEVGDDVESFYLLKGKPLDLALKVMLSKEGNEFFESLDVPRSINFVNVTDVRSGAIIFEYFNIQDKTGLVIGDKVKLNSALNTIEANIIGFDFLDDGGSVILVDNPLVNEPEYSGSFSYRSKYNTLSTGLGMLTSEVDVEQFETTKIQSAGSFVDYEIYIKDSIDNAKDFIDQQLFFPQGLYSIPRKARSSVKSILPPFSSDIVPYLGTENILNATSIKQRRSIHKYHYNTYVFKYNIDSIEDKYLTGKIIVSGDSIDRIPIGKKQLKIESDGLRDNPETTNIIENTGQRLIDRYQFAPTYFDDIEVNYKTGYALEVGDVVPFGGEDLQIIDLATGDRGRKFELFEIYNKSLNIKTGNVKLSLVSTSFAIAARYAVVSLSSKLGTGSTTNRIRLKKAFDTGEYVKESDKWLRYAGQIVAIRSDDFTYYEEVELKGVDPSDSSFLLLEDDLSVAPQQDYIIEPAEYKDDAEENVRFKLEFGHFSPEILITEVINNKEFRVSLSDAVILPLGSSVVINSKDFTRDSFGQTLSIDSVDADLVTLNEEVSFTPQVGDVINNANFLDDGFPYFLI